MIPEQSAERRALIGEYVLGLLDDDQAEEVRELIRVDHEAAKTALEWEAHWLELSDRLPAQHPSAALWPRIQRSIGQNNPHEQTLAQRVWHSLNLWRLTSAALAFGLLVSLLPWILSKTPATPAYTAVLQPPGEAASPGWVVHIEEDGDLQLEPLVTDTIPDDRSVQLWTLIDPADGPRSLGLVQPGQPYTLSAEQIGQVQRGQLFELTLEPAGGSPLSRPTGKVLYIGRAVVASTE